MATRLAGVTDSSLEVEIADTDGSEKTLLPVPLEELVVALAPDDDEELIWGETSNNLVAFLFRCFRGHRDLPKKKAAVSCSNLAWGNMAAAE